MKLRISGNSIRLRLLRSDVTALIETGRVEATIFFGPETRTFLRYGLEHRSGPTQVEVVSAPSEFTVVLPAQQANAWAETEQVGIYATVDLRGNGKLDVIVEKDFACLDLSDADNSDTFANPEVESVC